MSATAAAADNAPQLSLEEFQAVNNRAKANKKQTGKGAGKNISVEPAKEQVNPAASLGDFLEMPQVQAFMVFMIVIDIFAAFLLVLIRMGEVQIGTNGIGAEPGLTPVAASVSVGLDQPAEAKPLSLVKLITTYLVSAKLLQNVLTSFTGFAQLFFALEMLTVLLVFNLAVMGHVGYMMDCIVVSAQLYTELSGSGIESRLLSLLRFWRLARLVGSLVGIEKEAHEKTKALMADKEGASRQLEGEIKRSSEELEKEKEARKAVDEMLASYKEEVDMLNEALKIAAMDIAEVAEADDDLLLSDDESELLGNRTGGGDENDFVDASGSAYDKARNREALMREARRDTYNPQAAALRRAKESGNATFHIHEDGTFDMS
jgi:hypothetical protein